MAEDREPPPMDPQSDLFADEDDDDDIFKSATSQPVLTTTTEHEISLNDEEDDDGGIGGGDGNKNDNDDSKQDVKPKQQTLSESPDEQPHTQNTNNDHAPSSIEESGDDLFPPESSNTPVVGDKEPAVSDDNAEEEEQTEEGEEEDKFNIEITINNPYKIGDGMNAYMVYQLNTITNIPAFRKSEFAVKRRFSDFLGLHDKLVVKYQCKGIIIPKAPEKSAMGMAKVKMSKEESGSQDFVEKRRAALERYMNRTVAHPQLRMDPDVRDFLTMDTDLPKASSTSALSAAGVMRLFGKVGDAVTKLSASIPESDSWFEDKIQLIEEMEIQLRKLHESAESLVVKRHVASQNASILAKALGILANTDENATLKQALSKLSEVEDNMQQIYEEQADSDFFTLSELLKDYLSLLSAVKDVFIERIKIYKRWKDAEATLSKKRETLNKLQLAHKTDKIPQAENECKEWEQKVDAGENDFNKISSSLKKEMSMFDKKRYKDFKANLTNYLEKLLNNNEQLVEFWEGFLPEAKAVA